MRYAPEVQFDSLLRIELKTPRLLGVVRGARFSETGNWHRKSQKSPANRRVADRVCSTSIPVDCCSYPRLKDVAVPPRPFRLLRATAACRQQSERDPSSGSGCSFSVRCDSELGACPDARNHAKAGATTSTCGPSTGRPPPGSAAPERTTKAGSVALTADEPSGRTSCSRSRPRVTQHRVGRR